MTFISVFRVSNRPWYLSGFLFLSTLIVSACQTTGDPRQGGLFGWSEEQARARQSTLEQENTDAQRSIETEKGRSQMLQGRKASLQAESARVQSELDRMLIENAEIENELRNLMARKQLGNNELARLKLVLAENERLRKATRASATAPTALPQSARPDAINEQNRILHREVMILLGG